MAENSGIEWTHHTFNPWIGCTKISPACDNCYAADWDKRYNKESHWGNNPRRRTKNWADPVKWNKKAAAAGIRYRVFCASLADVFDNQVPEEWRADLFELIKATPHLDWLLLTKRPQNIAKFLPPDWGNGYKNVWLGATIENQDEADRRLWIFLQVPAALHFLSMEPLLSRVDISPWLVKAPYGDCSGRTDPHSEGTHSEGTNQHPRGQSIGWVITGGESGPHYRPANPAWFTNLRDQCAAAGVPFLFKQWSGFSQVQIKKLGRQLDGVVHDGYPQVAA